MFLSFHFALVPLSEHHIYFSVYMFVTFLCWGYLVQSTPLYFFFFNEVTEFGPMGTFAHVLVHFLTLLFC